MKYILGPLTEEQKELVDEALGDKYDSFRADSELAPHTDEIDALPGWREVPDDWTV